MIENNVDYKYKYNETKLNHFIKMYLINIAGTYIYKYMYI